jgi:hypothetical protein
MMLASGRYFTPSVELFEITAVSELPADPIPGVPQARLKRAFQGVVRVGPPRGPLVQVMKFVAINRQQHSSLVQGSYLVPVGEQVTARQWQRVHDQAFKDVCGLVDNHVI